MLLIWWTGNIYFYYQCWNADNLFSFFKHMNFSGFFNEYVTSDQFNASLLDKIIHFLYVCLCGICFWYITFKTSKINTSALRFNIQRKRQKWGWFLVKTVPGFPEDSVILDLTHTACSPNYPWFIAVRVRLCSHCPTSLSQSPTITLKLTPAAGWASL